MRMATRRDASSRREYTFGQDDLAARRLRELDEVFGPGSRALLDELRPLGPFEAALDLGCGPGFTTAAVAAVLAPRRLVGIDTSDTFLSRARLAVPEATFIHHDLRRPPYPGAPADLIYARYVLGHLGEAERWIATWAAQLTPGGVLAVEDNEWIATQRPTFARYLDLARHVMASNHADLYPGARLAAAAAGRLRVLASRVVEVEPASAAVARMFRHNLAAWARRPAALAHREELARLDEELHRLEGSSARGEIVWGVRQVAGRLGGDPARASEKPISGGAV
jgi:trans-aconitate 2-methyltransferase